LVWTLASEPVRSILSIHVSQENSVARRIDLVGRCIAVYLYARGEAQIHPHRVASPIVEV